VAGDSQITGDSTSHAFRWTQAGGMVDLGTLGGTSAYAYALSADGSVVAGNSYLTDNSAYRAFRWTQAGGMVDLGTLGGTNSFAYALSADGSVVAGDSQITDNSTSHAFRWTQAGGMVDLGTLGGTYSSAYALSADGSVVAGDSQITGDSTSHAFRWTQATGMADLNTLLTDAGVDMTGIELNGVTAISANGQIMAASGNNYSSVYIVRYIDATVADPVPAPTPGPPVMAPIAGITTGAAQQQATQQLAAAQRSTLVENRSSANSLLGMTRPMNTSNYSYAGGMFGSAVGYTGAQYSANNFTILGGFAYGAQEYPGVKQDAAVTIAAALRYSFPDPFGDAEQALHPFFEVGGWLTPSATLALTRTYANGSGTASGTAATETTSGSFYGRLGLAWQVTPDDQLVGFTELGQQYMQFDGYSEEMSPTNPFPASVEPGLVRFGVMRAGGSWTHSLTTLDFDATTNIPLSVTLAGAAARSFAVHSGLTATISGVGQTTASNQSDTWGEFGARLQAQLTDNLGVSLDLNGTTGGPANRTSLHGGVGVSLTF
jgi:probable HAF family extracellular repeat protein